MALDNGTALKRGPDPCSQMCVFLFLTGFSRFLSRHFLFTVAQVTPCINVIISCLSHYSMLFLLSIGDVEFMLLWLVCWALVGLCPRLVMRLAGCLHPVVFFSSLVSFIAISLSSLFSMNRLRFVYSVPCTC